MEKSVAENTNKISQDLQVWAHLQISCILYGWFCGRVIATYNKVLDTDLFDLMYIERFQRHLCLNLCSNVSIFVWICVRIPFGITSCPYPIPSLNFCPHLENGVWRGIDPISLSRILLNYMSSTLVGKHCHYAKGSPFKSFTYSWSQN